MKRLSSFLLIIFSVQISLFPLGLNAEYDHIELIPSSPLLVRINEVAWMGSDLSTADEWIELTAIPVQTGSVLTEPVNLNGWTLSIQKDSGEAVVATVETDLLIGSGQYLVIANSAATSSRLKSEPAVLSSAMSLPNTKLKVFLRDTTGTLIDEVDDVVGAPFAGANPSASSGLPKATMERISPRLSGVIKESWRTADISRGFDAGSTMRGTPGYENGTIEPPDMIPPSDLHRVIAYSHSGTTLMSWNPCNDPDCAGIEVTVGAQTMMYPAASSGARLSAAVPDIFIRTRDEQGNNSDGLVIQVQPLLKPIIGEFIPNPVGTDDGEWIELQNLHPFALDLGGWTLSAGSRRWMIPVGTVIAPFSVLTPPASLTGLQLPNAGGSLALSLHGFNVDRIDYTEVPEGVSLGRLDDGGMTITPFCLPTPGEMNTVRSPVIDIVGIEQGMTVSSSINVDIRALSGSIVGASCSVDFGDGYVSTSCNPPSHAMKQTGDSTITATVKDYCGNTVIHSETIMVLGSGKSKTAMKETQVPSPECTPTPSDGLMVSEIYPAPTTGEEEWVELRNMSDVPVDLCGWSLDDIDGGSNPFKLDGRSVLPGGYLALSSKETGIAWNNDADTARLIGPMADGGTGVVLAFPYTDSLKQQSFAWRSDNVFVWSPYPSPGQENRFVLPNTDAGYSPVILSAALPNPEGVDTFDEWIELENITGRPQWLNGWVLESSDGKNIVFDKRVLAKREQQKVYLHKTGMTLRNTDGVLKLYDNLYTLRSVLAWNTTKDGQVYRPDRVCDETPIAQIRMLDTLSFRARESTEPGTPYFDFGLSGVLLPAATIDPSFENHNKKAQNYISTLINNKKLVYKKCSNDHESLVVEDADLALLLLSLGYVFTDTTADREKIPEMLVYEEEARMNKRGIWIDDEHVLLVDTWRRGAEMDAIVLKEGVTINVSHKPGLVMPGSIVSVSSNVPVQWEVRRGTGAYIPFAGSVSILDRELLSFRAWYEFLTASGTEVRSSVVTREYDLLQQHYPACIRINEVYPSPVKDEKEWIELMNICDEPVSLLGWVIDDQSDGGSRPFTIGSGYVLQPQSMIVLSGAQLPIALNNSGDSVMVIGPDKRMQDAMTYGKTSSKQSIAVVSEAFCTTITSTPGSHNICQKPLPKQPKGKKGLSKVREIGIRTLYAGVLSHNPSNMNKNSDQYNRFMEGLNSNFIFENSSKFGSVLFTILLLLGTSALTVAIWLKVRSYGSLS